MKFHFWVFAFLLLFSQGNSSCYADPCSIKQMLSGFFTSEDDRSKKAYEKLTEISHSKMIDRTLSDSNSAFHQMYDAIRNYRTEKGEQAMRFYDDQFEINGLIYSDKNSMVVEIHSILISDLEAGANPKGANTSFYKFAGSLFRGIEKNAEHFPRQFESVSIVGVGIKNARLRQVLDKFGFKAGGLPNKIAKKINGLSWEVKIPIKHP